MYNVTIDLPCEDSNPGFMDTGIHENVELVKVEYGKTSNEFIAFYFTNEKGERLSHTEWKPTGTDMVKVAEKELNQMSRIKQIVTCFVPQDKFIFQSTGFEDFAKKTIAILGDAYKGIKLRVKVVYTGKYTSLPNSWKPRFIERMDNNHGYGDPKRNSKIVILSIDKLSRPETKSDPIPTTSNPFTTGTQSTDVSPF